MKKMIINGKEIMTNYGKEYQIFNGDRDMAYKPSKCGEDDKILLERLVNEGYTRITFYYGSTGIRGLYKLYAYCKRP